MSKHCCPVEPAEKELNSRSRHILFVALILNAGMFGIEVWQGSAADSVSLFADSIDFLGDAANYAISLYVLGKALTLRAKASLVKAACMGGFAVWVLGNAVYNAFHPVLPEHVTMGWVGLLALAVNILCAVMLFKTRKGDSNMQSVWLCSRNDAIGNVVVIIAAYGVYASGTVWPDLIAATFLATLALSSAWQVIRTAKAELYTHL